jgi:hypothetical protein
MTKLDRAFTLAKTGEPFGLLCSPEGLSLAGAPLLRRGVAGFTPRPAGELAALLKAAYGAAETPGDLTVGLRVVADALNAGDLARAMIAAVQLRLPPLDWSGGERIAHAEAALAKYDPGESRDERGRWTTGGAATAVPQNPEPVAPAAATGDDPGDLGSMAFGANPFADASGRDPVDAKVLQYLASRANDWRYTVDPKTGALLFEGKPLDPAAAQAWKERQLGAPSGLPGVVSEREQMLRAKLSQLSPAQAEVATYPHALDATVENYVAQYNQSKGFRPGDREYLDPDLIKAMIMQESAHDLKAFNSDPMQVNANSRDWDKAKAPLGLVRGVAPGPSLSVEAGIKWLIYKSYVRANDPDTFKGWFVGVVDYNHTGHVAYGKSVFGHLAVLKQAEQDAEDQ